MIVAAKMEISKSYRIKKFSDEEIAGKLLIMGFLPETKILLVRKSPFGRAFYFNVNGNKIALRKEEAEAIIVN